MPFKALMSSFAAALIASAFVIISCVTLIFDKHIVMHLYYSCFFNPDLVTLIMIADSNVPSIFGVFLL